MIELNNIEKKVLKALNALGGRAYIKKIADKANTSSATTSKYLMSLENKDIVKSDATQPPHIYWEFVKSNELDNILKSVNK